MGCLHTKHPKQDSSNGVDCDKVNGHHKPNKLCQVDVQSVENEQQSAKLKPLVEPQSAAKYFQSDIVPNDQRLSVKYAISGVLGHGLCAWVFSAKSKATERKVAIKAVSLSKFNADTEIRILSRVVHPNVIGLIEVLQSPKWAYIILETGEGPTVEQWLDSHEMMEESEANNLVIQLLEALNYLHELGITHRNLNPQHMILNRNSIEARVQIISFSEAHCGRPREFDMKGARGTLEFCAPEAISGHQYSSQIDMWSLGVCLHQFVSGDLPFLGGDSIQMLHSIGRFEPTLSNPRWDSFSVAVKSFIDCCFLLDPERRLSPWVGLRHPWIRPLVQRAESWNSFESLVSIGTTSSFKHTSFFGPSTID